MNNLQLYFKCNHLFLNCNLKKDSIEFAFSSQSSANNLIHGKFQSLCHLKHNPNSNLEIFDHKSTPNFQFLLVGKKYDKNDPLDNNLKPEIFNLLFQNAINFDKVILISPSDGYVYWYPICLSKPNDFSTNLNDFILFNTQSKVVLIETFRQRELSNPLDSLIKTHLKSDGSNKCHTCLFVVAKNGKVFIYAFQSRIVYKISVLAHCVVFCVKIKHLQNDYLIYSNDANEIYAVLLEELVSSSNPKYFFLTKAKSIKKIKKESENVYYVEASGKANELNLKNVSPNDKSHPPDSSDLSRVNALLEKLSLKSSKIVQGQLQIDKLNSAIKQLGILQANKYGLSKNFEISKQFKNNKIEINIQNKNTLMENTNNCLFVLCCIRYEKFNGDFHRAFIWQNHLEHFDATKASMQQVLVKDSTKFIKIKMFPAQLRLFLIFDIQKFLHSNVSLLNNQVKFDDDLIEKMGNFCVPIYDSNFSIHDFLLPLNHSEMIIEPSINVLMSFLLKKNILQDKSKLNNLWTYLKLEGSCSDFKEMDGKRSLVFSNFELSVKKNDQDTFSVKFELKTPSNEIYSDLATLIYAKNSLILKNLACSKAFYYATTKSNSNQKELLESIVSKLEDLVALKNSSYMILENRIEVDEQFDESFEKKNKFHSIETLLSLIHVYLNLRQILCSNLKVN